MTSPCATKQPETADVLQSLPAAEPRNAEVAATTVERLLLEIRRDSRAEPLRYLDEIQVPCGGE
jgi:hypothetical protein